MQKNEDIDIINIALDEDLGTGDITTDSTIPQTSISRAVIKAKEDGVIAGLNILEKIYSGVSFSARIKDGFSVKKGDIIAEVVGRTRVLLSRERVALNFLQRLSGIATITKKIVEASGGKAKILDTRKTTPGMRKLEKYAVRAGGGRNHRMGLYDMVLIKDNHIKAAGGIRKAVEKAKEKSDKRVEVEVTNLEELKEALESKPDMIMLDNMPVEDMKKAVQIVNKSVVLEASGGVTLDNIKEIAETGVDYISIGRLTHSVRALDISMDIVESK